jgi:hypothetical protein
VNLIENISFFSHKKNSNELFVNIYAGKLKNVQLATIKIKYEHFVIIQLLSHHHDHHRQLMIHSHISAQFLFNNWSFYREIRQFSLSFINYFDQRFNKKMKRYIWKANIESIVISHVLKKKLKLLTPRTLNHKYY